MAKAPRLTLEEEIFGRKLPPSSKIPEGMISAKIQSIAQKQKEFAVIECGKVFLFYKGKVMRAFPLSRLRNLEGLSKELCYLSNNPFFSIDIIRKLSIALDES